MYKVISETEIVDKATGEFIFPLFYSYSSPLDYERAEVLPVEPMTAKEYLNDSELDKMLNSTEYMAEEKLDGTRATMHLRSEGNRLFSRRISKKTNWYAENTDSVPHLRDFKVDNYMYGTVLDGEMLIDGKEFKDVSSTLNCNWGKAIERQTELGFITFWAFDIIYYKGIYIAKMPLYKRKKYLEKIIKEMGCDYVKLVPYTYDTQVITITPEVLRKFRLGQLKEYAFPNLYNVVGNLRPTKLSDSFTLEVDKLTWYEYIVFTGGEGLMLKPKEGNYKHTRGREFTKLKKYDTWDCVALDFMPPTKEYTGKELATWKYWYHPESDCLLEHVGYPSSDPDQCDPVTKHYFKGWIGTIKYGVLITDSELLQWKNNNPKEKLELVKLVDGTQYLVVGEASGFDEATREEITNNKVSYLGKVLELKAQEVLKTGKLRHPRVLRWREDKEPERCTWKDHQRK